MSDIIISEKYAQAFYEICEEKRVSDDIYEVWQHLDQVLNNDSLYNVLKHPLVGGDVKKELIREVIEHIEGKSKKEILNFLYLLIDKKRINMVRNIFNSFTKILQEERNIQVVHVFTPGVLTNEQKNKTIEALEKHTGKKVVLKEAVDPAMVGGIIIKIGTRLMDGSLAAKINRFGESLRQATGKIEWGVG